MARSHHGSVCVSVCVCVCVCVCVNLSFHFEPNLDLDMQRANKNVGKTPCCSVAVVFTHLPSSMFLLFVQKQQTVN